MRHGEVRWEKRGARTRGALRAKTCTCRLGAGSTKVIVCGVRIARTFLLPVQPGVLDTRSKSCATLARACTSSGTREKE